MDSNTAHELRSGDNFQNSVLSSSTMGSGNGTQVVRSGWPGRLPLSTGPTEEYWPTEHLTHWASYQAAILKSRNNSYWWILLLSFCKKKKQNEIQLLSDSHGVTPKPRVKPQAELEVLALLCTSPPSGRERRAAGNQHLGQPKLLWPLPTQGWRHGSALAWGYRWTLTRRQTCKIY